MSQSSVYGLDQDRVSGEPQLPIANSQDTKSKTMVPVMTSNMKNSEPRMN